MYGYGRLAAVAGLAAAGVLLAACGNSSTATGTGGGTGGAPAASNAAIGTSMIGGVGKVLVDRSGKTLYFDDQEANGTVRCTGSCLGVWIPATTSGTSVPNGSVAGVSVMKRKDNGMEQLAYQGKPLYQFKLDSMPGQASGNGAQDQFNGTSFTWHAAVVAGSASAPGSSTGNSGGGIPGY